MRLSPAALDVAAVQAMVRTDGDGAVCCFAGFIRDHSGSGRVTSLDYEAYDAMAVGEMRRIGEATLMATGATALAIEHRTGALVVGEAGVVVAASAPHRAVAFDACRQAIEAVKRDVPIWKLEHGVDGGSSWVGAPDATPHLSHVTGDQVRMVDVSAKAETEREAVAAGTVRCDAATARLIAGGGGAKGPVLDTARIAGVMAAKRTADLIPMCHPLALTHVALDLVVDEALPGVRITASVRCAGRTGVEMEALTAVSVAGLTVIDMAKSADRWMTLEGVGLVHKRGGRSGAVSRPDPAAQGQS